MGPSPGPEMKELSEPFASHKRDVGATDELDVDLESGSEIEVQGPNAGNLSTVRLSSKKKEALSQVPCKFFRSNGCSAGTACPFAHIMPGEGQGKAICQWFLKGSCRFGHKCALAHILPGQPISMDRKNKRAAHQQQQQMLQPTSHVAPFNGHGAAQVPPPLYPDQFANHQNLPFPFRNGPNNEMRDQVASTSRLGQQNQGGQYHHRETDLLFGVPDDLQMPSGGQSRNGNVASSAHAAGLVSTPPDWQTNLSRLQNIEGDLNRARQVDHSFENPADRATTSRTGTVSMEAFGTSPFSNPGSQSVFYSNRAPSKEFSGMGKPHTGQAGQDEGEFVWGKEEETGELEKDEINEEDFLPSSLSDLLTPAELQRRSKGGLRNNAFKNSLIPQSMPASSTLRDDHFFQADKGTEADFAPRRQDAADFSVDPTGFLLPRSDGQRFGASNTSNGFLASALGRNLTNRREDMAGTREMPGSGPLDAYNPSIEAAFMHAPGQSLPPGLAAGLSRLQLQRDDVNEDARERHCPDVEPLSTSNKSIWNRNQTQKISVAGVGSYPGSARSSEELGPIAPSSIFAHKTPMHLAMSRSTAGPIGSGSTSLDHHQQHHHQATGSNSHANAFLSTSVNGSIGSGTVFSPYARSPAVHNEGGIAIPSSTTANSTGLGSETSFASIAAAHQLSATSNSTRRGVSNNNNTSSINSKSNTAAPHPGMQRVRTSGHNNAIAGSPLAVPITGEEVEEPIFELE